MSFVATAAVAQQRAPLVDPEAPAEVRNAASPPPAKKARVAKPAAKAAAAKDGADADPANPGVSAKGGKMSAADAQRAVVNGIKLLQDGKIEPSIQVLTAAIASSALPPTGMGQALMHRGLAYRTQKKPAQAISDLTSALWLKNGLTPAERRDALAIRADAYRDAGLPDQTTGEELALAPAPVSSSQKPAAAGAAPAQTAAASESSGIGGFFSNLFGGGSSPQAASSSAAPSPQIASSWAQETETHRAAPAPKSSRSAAAVASHLNTATPPPAAAASVAAPVAAAVAAAPVAGNFRARVALVRTKTEADAISQRLQSEFAAVIGPRTPEIDQASFGGMGSFFQVRVGPFATLADASSACKQLKGPGIDCVAVDR